MVVKFRGVCGKGSRVKKEATGTPSYKAVFLQVWSTNLWHQNHWRCLWKCRFLSLCFKAGRDDKWDHGVAVREVVRIPGMCSMGATRKWMFPEGRAVTCSVLLRDHPTWRPKCVHQIYSHRQRRWHGRPQRSGTITNQAGWSVKCVQGEANIASRQSIGEAWLQVLRERSAGEGNVTNIRVWVCF